MMAAALTLALSATPLKAAGGPASAPLARVARQVSADDLVKQLGSDDPKARDAAQAALEKLGDAAEPALNKAAEGDDAEIRGRVRALLRGIESRRAGYLVFFREGSEHRDNLVRADFDGANLKLVVEGVKGTAAHEAVCSPDGSTIAFSSNRDGEHALWVVDWNGEHLKNLTKGRIRTRGVGSISWSPDGRRILFECEDPELVLRQKANTVCTIDPDGENLTLITDARDYEAEPAWSPDGKRIALAHATKMTPNSYADMIWTDFEMDLVVASSDGKERRRLTHVANQIHDIRWTPDGKRITFVAFKEKGGVAINLIDADGTNLRVIHEYPEHHSVRDLAWFEDGKRIVYTVYGPPDLVTEFEQTARVVVFDVERRTSAELSAPKAMRLGRPAISPDGRHMAFSTSFEVFVGDLDGGPSKKIVSDANLCTTPSWGRYPK